MHRRLTWVAGALLLAGCGGQTSGASNDGGTPGLGDAEVSMDAGPPPQSDASTGADTGAPPDTGTSGVDGGIVINPTPATKVDLLFMIDNSETMDDKQNLLALAVPTLLTRLTNPECLDASGNPTGTSADGSGNCPSGSTPQFPAVTDMHVGIVSSSLGGRGGNVCPDIATNPVNSSLNAHDNDNGELIARTGVAGNPTVESTIADTGSLNFLSYFPNVIGNTGKPTPPTPAIGSPATLVGDFTSLVYGVHDHGCSFAAQNEAWYRFLVQPDPFATISVVPSGTATVSGIDQTILQQRASFLRPDSVVVVVVITDSNERADDPLSIDKQGWALNSFPFPGSQSGGGAPEGTTQCSGLDPNNPSTTGPNDSNCQSCALLSSSSPNFAMECPKDGMNGNAGYLDPSDDAINLRYFHQKERFGLSSAYPVTRYVRGLQRTTVPSVGLAFQGDTDHEHDMNGNYVGDEDANANCVNPLFATNLPTSASQDLCHLTPGSRGANHVFYATIAGVPHQLLQATPGESDSYGSCPASTPAAQCPQKTTLSSADWELILGNDPMSYDFRGADFHMIESEVPRTVNTGLWANASQCPPSGSGPASATCDPINGSEYQTNKADLQFSCIFPLVDLSGATVVPFDKDCTQAEYTGACGCSSSALDSDSPLCDPTTPTTQIYAQGYPSLRELAIAKAMATESAGSQTYDQSIVSSVCPIAVDVGMATTQALADPLFGYNPAMNAIVDRIATSL